MRTFGVGISTMLVLLGVLACNGSEPSDADPEDARAFSFEANAGEPLQELFNENGLIGEARCGPPLADGNPDLSAWVRSRVREASVALVLGDPDGYTSSFRVNDFGPRWGPYDFLGNVPDGRVGVLSFVRPDGTRMAVSFSAAQDKREKTCELSGEYRTVTDSP